MTEPVTDLQARIRQELDGPDLSVLGGYTAAGLQDLEFPPPIWVVPDLIPEGLTILGGKPKQGKSWFCLGIALSVAAGGVALGALEAGPPRDVLYVALEDNPRRMQKRIRALSVEPDARWPNRLRLFHRWPRLDEGGIDYLDAWRNQVQEPGLVIVDTYQRVRPPTRGRSVYAEDYTDLIPLHEWSHQSAVPVVGVHHQRKADSPDDWIDTLSGSTGMTGCVDTIAVLFRERGRLDATLRITGRDIENDPELALEFSGGSWTTLGDAARYRMELSRERILGVVADHGEPMTPKEVAVELDDITHDNIKKTMLRMADAGELDREARGRYKAPATKPVPRVPMSPNQEIREILGDIGTEGTGLAVAATDDVL